MNTADLLREAQALLADILDAEVLPVDLTDRASELEVKIRAVVQPS